MTSQYPPDCQPGALEKAVLPESLQGVGRAGRGEAAGRRLKWGYADLVETDEHNQREDGHLPDYLENTLTCILHGRLPS